MKKQDLILISVFTALICASWLIVIPLGVVPIVMQNAIILATAAVLGYLGIICVCIFLGLGILGLPVFYAGRAGIVAFLNPTGGYLVGYLIGAIVVAILVQNFRQTKINIILILALGFLVIYIPGVFWLKFSLELSLKEAILKGFLPFILPDIVKLIFLVPIVLRLKKVVKR